MEPDVILLQKYTRTYQSHTARKLIKDFVKLIKSPEKMSHWNWLLIYLAASFLNLIWFRVHQTKNASQVLKVCKQKFFLSPYAKIVNTSWFIQANQSTLSKMFPNNYKLSRNACMYYYLTIICYYSTHHCMCK